MRSYHITKRGSRYHFVCRVPVDLRQFFPISIIYRSLKTCDFKAARLLAATLEHETQGVFMRLRSGHLDENAIKMMITNYLGRELEVLEARLMHGAIPADNNLPKEDRRRLRVVNDFAPLGEMIDLFSAGGAVQLAGVAADRESRVRAEITSGDYKNEREVRKLAEEAGYRLKSDKLKAVQLRQLQIKLKLATAERAARQDGDYSLIEDLKNFLAREKSAIKPRFYLGEVIDDYMKKYDDPKCTVTRNSLRAVRRETKTIREVFGNNSELAQFNTATAKKKLEKALEKRMKSTGEPLAKKTIVEYVKRLNSLVNYVIDKNELDVNNKIKGTYDAKGSIKNRKSYGSSDLKKIEDALCCAPMLTHEKKPEPRSDRFWIILIAILQGFRKSAIVDMCEHHITIDDDSQLPCFDLTLDADPSGKTRILSPMHPLLIKVGLLKWLDKTRTGNPSRKLFEDDPESFGNWWNGSPKYEGWSREHVTTEEKKTFHSLRHYFTMWIDELDISEKLKSEMSGHAVRYVGDDVRTSHYLERTRIIRMREVQTKSTKRGKVLIKDVDWTRLTVRAKELFAL